MDSIFHFEIVSPESNHSTFELSDGVVWVGRGDGNQIVIRDKTVSREHCELHLYHPEIIVRERDSRNGVFVDGVRVNGQSEVKHGQMLRIGRILIRVFLHGPLGPQASALTAVDDLRRFEAESKQVGAVVFPLVIEPTKLGGDRKEGTGG